MTVVSKQISGRAGTTGGPAGTLIRDEAARLISESQVWGGGGGGGGTLRASGGQVSNGWDGKEQAEDRTDRL